MMHNPGINGKRVKLVQGTPKGSSGSERHNVSMWCAGDIPVGAIGTVAPVYVDQWNTPCRNDRGHGTCNSYMQIHWDEHNPKGDYFFAIMNLTDFEVIK